MNLSDDISELKKFSREKALECMRKTSVLSRNNSVEYCIAKLERYGISLPDDYSDEEILHYSQDENFWFRRVKQLASQTMEQVRRELGKVNQKKSAYCSSDRARQFEWEREQAEEYMKTHYLVNQDGERISMHDAYKSNVSNPSVRRAELMVRIKGTEEYSKMLEHEGWFFTLTTPSKYHSHYKSGKSNPKYAGSSVKEANDYLNKQWCKARAQFDRENIQVYGLRVVEPHHDGTPHWHLMMFMPPENSARVNEILEHYALEHDSHEKGAQKSRFKAEKIVAEKGSAQDYIAKYICKNIDGEYLDTDKYGNDAKDAATRISAWASLYRIRQFQFIGLPNVGLWRELRKLRERTGNSQLESLRIAADSGDWLSYLIMMGGSNIKRVERPFSLEYEKLIKSIFSDCPIHALSTHAFIRKPIALVSTLSRFLLPKNNWELLRSPPDHSCPRAHRQGEHVNNYDSGGHRRRIGTFPPWREGSERAEGILDLCK